MREGAARRDIKDVEAFRMKWTSALDTREKAVEKPPMSETFPVTVAVTRPDGSVEQVRVGSAIRVGDGFSVSLGELRIEGRPEATRRAMPASRSPGADAGSMVFPPYGRSKGMPIVGASMQDLEFYANGSRRTLSDPAKARWHDKERVLLAAIEGEIARQQGGDQSFESGVPEPDAVPPPGDDDAPF